MEILDVEPEAVEEAQPALVDGDQDLQPEPAPTPPATEENNADQ